MPIFEYECEKCGEKFEYFQWAGEDAASLKCPKCGETKTKRVMSTFSKRDGSCAPRQSG
jgi:putative FmdB family regulatory protein